VSAAAASDRRFVVALAALPAMGPVRLAALLAAFGPEEAWARVVAGSALHDIDTATSARGDIASLTARWRAAASTIDVDALWRAHAGAGIAVLVPDDEGFPPTLVEDPEPPAVLFVQGSLDALQARRVAVVGTRRCTWSGRAVARSLGADLVSRAGACVISGLALGIDGEAHSGALDAGGRPVAVVATGLDVVYPRRHAGLWARVAEAGAVVSEHPLGTTPERWRFPARNRLIAGLAEVVVVVESAVAGGSMHTVDAALERDRTVLAVPGPVRSPASTGTNGLLAAGCSPCRDADDVLVALGLDSSGTVTAVATPDDADQALVLEALGWEPATLDELAERLGVPLGPVAVHLTRLASAGWVVQRSGWWERAR
jgi:DNA processing protein